MLLSLLLLGAAPGPRRGAAFYLPGLAPVNFCEEEKKTDECKVGAARRTTPPLTLPWVSLPLGLALGSPIFPSGCEGKLGVALESLQGLRDLT